LRFTIPTRPTIPNAAPNNTADADCTSPVSGSAGAGGVGDAEDVVYRIITVLVLHQLAIEKALYLYGCLNNPLFQNNISSIQKV